MKERYYEIRCKQSDALIYVHKCAEDGCIVMAAIDDELVEVSLKPKEARELASILRKCAAE